MSPIAVRGPYRTGIKRRREVLEAAAQVFGQYGYAAGSLRQIADRVGVTPAALIRLFGSKEGLLTALLEYWNTESTDAATRENAGVEQAGLAHFRSMEWVMHYHTTHRGLLELFLTLTIEATNPAHPARQFILNRYNTLITRAMDALAEAGRRGETRAFTAQEREREIRQLFAVMDGIEIQWLLDPSIDLVATFRHAYEKILAGWAPRAE
jgi:AcrR family transcriptional regulator